MYLISESLSKVFKCVVVRSTSLDLDLDFPVGGCENFVLILLHHELSLVSIANTQNALEGNGWCKLLYTARSMRFTRYRNTLDLSPQLHVLLYAGVKETLTPFLFATVTFNDSVHGSASRLSSARNSCISLTTTYADSVKTICCAGQMRGPPRKGT